MSVSALCLKLKFIICFKCFITVVLSEVFNHDVGKIINSYLTAPAF